MMANQMLPAIDAIDALIAEATTLRDEMVTRKTENRLQWGVVVDAFFGASKAIDSIAIANNAANDRKDAEYWKSSEGQAKLAIITKAAYG